MTSCFPSNFLELPSFNVSDTSSGFDDDDDDLLLSGIICDFIPSFSSESRQS